MSKEEICYELLYVLESEVAWNTHVDDEGGAVSIDTDAVVNEMHDYLVNATERRWN